MSIFQTTVRALVICLVFGGAAFTLSGCNTTAGAGQDVSATGRAMTNGAETVKSKL